LKDTKSKGGPPWNLSLGIVEGEKQLPYNKTNARGHVETPEEPLRLLGDLDAAGDKINMPLITPNARHSARRDSGVWKRILEGRE